MTQYKNIPQPGDNRNVSQNDILQNFLYLSNPLTGAPGTNGIIPVDHQASGDNSATPKDGFHNQVSYNSQARKANTTNAINGQTADGITYLRSTSSVNFPQELWYIFGNDAAATNYKQVNLSMIKGVGYFQSNAASSGTGSYNIKTSTVNGSDVYSVTFQNDMPDTNYCVFFGPENPVLCFGFLISSTKSVSGFSFAFFNINGTRIRPQNFSLQIIENITV